MSGEKARRRARITETLRKEPVRSQEALREALEEHGIEVTQSALSRDLREMGVVKTPVGYALPGVFPGALGALPRFAPPMGGALKPVERALREFLLSASVAGQLVVVKTSPGRANALSIEIDGAGLSGVVGTIAGDDTIFLATASERNARTVFKHLTEMAGIH